MNRVLILLIVCCTSCQLLIGQKSKTVAVAYFAPYFGQIGGKVGLAFDLKTWQGNSAKGNMHQLKVSPQLGYFVYPNVQENLFINSELTYQINSPDKRFYPMVGLGLGYLLGRQRQDGSVDLATGTISHNREALHHLVPTLSLGLGRKTEKSVGYYFKAFFGRKITFSAEYAAFFGLELGVNFKL